VEERGRLWWMNWESSAGSGYVCLVSWGAPHSNAFAKAACDVSLLLARLQGVN
jgi:hypothetical protein